MYVDIVRVYPFSVFVNYAVGNKERKKRKKKKGIWQFSRI